MSFYGQGYKYQMTNHALTRAKQRFNLAEMTDWWIHLQLEEFIAEGIIQEQNETNGDVVIYNPTANITIVVNEKQKIIKTVY